VGDSLNHARTCATRESGHDQPDRHVTPSGAEEPRCERRSWRQALPQPDKGGDRIRDEDMA
jgi:hypothetical protein